MKSLPIVLLAFLFFLHKISYAQAPATHSSADIYLQLKKLKVLGSVLYIAAHPDDENTRLLAYLSKEKMYRTGYLSLTRGDGGQNLIGNEQGVELGLIRTQELLAARRIDGAEQFFTRAYDFGFSKNAAEAMRIWNKEKILSDVVWVIRQFRPDVIITRFPGDERAGHGHHAASSLLANEAFAAAADPNRFPEQLQYVKPWQAKRILWNTFNFGGTNTTAENQLKINVGLYNPLLGKGYGEIAAESRSQHKSQGFGVPRQRGESLEYFKTTGGTAPKEDLFDSIYTGWGRSETLDNAYLDGDIDKIIDSFSFANPAASAEPLLKLYNKLGGGSSYSYWEKQKAREVQDIIEECLGFYAEATTTQQYAVQGDTLKVDVLINQPAPYYTFIVVKRALLMAPAHFQEITVDSSMPYIILNDNKSHVFSIKIPVDTLLPLTQPYWLQKPMLPGSYTVTDQQLIGKPVSDEPLSVSINIEINNQVLNVVRPVRYKYTDPVRGELFQPLVVLPKFSAQEEYPLFIARQGVQNKMKVRYTANGALQNAMLGSGGQVFLKDTVAMARGSERFVELPYDRLHPLIKGATTMPLGLTKDTFMLDKSLPAVYPVSIRYDHIPNITYFRPAIQSTLNLDVKTVGKRIGYISGAGDRVPQALEQMGYIVVRLGENDLNAPNLVQYDAVITGVRAYNVSSFLGNKYSELMTYVRNGGNLIVQYNTNGNAPARIGPYPFTLSRNRITDESAEVHFDLPNHPALNYPNKITSKDFDGWIQERSIYQAEQLDSSYAAPISMADPGEKSSNGSLIISRFGKGNFVYTGLVFFRELPAGVAGAYRLMANLIALPKH